MTIRPYPAAGGPLAQDPDNITWELAQYLHDAGVAEVSDEERVLTGARPPVYLDDMPDEPDEALALYGPWEPSPDSLSNPLIRFGVLHRTPTRAGLGSLCQATYEALNRPYEFRLTADRSVMLCERVIIDPPVLDQNGRWRRVDTYQARIRPPESIYN